MSKQRIINVQRIIILTFLIGGLIFSIQLKKQRRLAKIYHKRAFEVANKKYQWKKHRLAVYIELVYTRLYND